MEEVIKQICNALQEEAEAVKSYTDKITSINQSGMYSFANDDVIDTFLKNRISAVEHIQSLTIELTKVFCDGYKKDDVKDGDLCE